ncbi:MAG: hypothetical protein GWO40_05620 [Gammaproteobacteria bacterium]|nr:hypothetical protein [Gammaproteobacteria bacterium]NIX85042.1 hypothetical protein [Gammaproteobacteria bacterium]
MRALSEKMHRAARSGATSGSAVNRAFAQASQILVGDVREAILSSYSDSWPGTVRTGALARSFREYVEVTQRRVRIGASSDLVYARIQDQGGRITPKTRKALAIPLRRVPVGKWPRHWPKGELFTLRKKDRPTGDTVGILYRKTGKRGRLQAMYLLRRSVKIPAKRYLDAAAKSARPKIAKLISRAIGEEVAGG